MEGATGMRRRIIVLTIFSAGISLAVTAAIATPALAKGATQASITGPGLTRPLTVSDQGEALPGEGDTLSSLAEQTGLFTVLFGSGGDTPDEPTALRTPPAVASLGPKYTVTYTVPGVTPRPGQANGQIRQDLYPRAAGGPAMYTPPGQQGFGQPLQASGWLRGTSRLTVTLTRLGVPVGASRSSTPRPATPAKPVGPTTPAWLIATIVSAVAVAIVGTVLWLRRRSRPATDPRAVAEMTGEPRLPDRDVRRSGAQLSGAPVAASMVARMRPRRSSCHGERENFHRSARALPAARRCRVSNPMTC
jgi:hypothetical protein